MIRTTIVAALAATAALTLAACGSGSAEPDQTAGTLTHKFGTTKLPADPKRIVTVGYNDHEFVLSLGQEPVGIRDWVGVGPVTEVPWAKDRIAAMKTKPKVLPRTDLDPTDVAALKPDLIIGIFGGMTKREYDTLSKIAPVVAPPKGFVDFGVPWQRQLEITGKALGRTDQAGQQVADLQARFDRAREANPQFARSDGLVGYQFEPGTLGAYAGGDLRSRFIRELGFKVPAKIDELAGEEFYVEFSKEQFRLMDQDAVVLYGAPRAQRQKALDDPLYQRLKAVDQGRVVYLDNEDALLGAIGLSTPYSLPYAVGEAVPRLRSAVDGDPSTKVPEAR